MARELKRLNMNMTVELLEQVDLYADKMNLNRSSAINLLVSSALEQKNVVEVLTKVMIQMQEEKSKEK